jgi:nitrate reductase / nitrite oxidoreductase, alpha subunit
MWSGLIENGRAYSPFTYNVERLVPWRTLTGRQHFYLDHPLYIAVRRAPADLQAEAAAGAVRDLRSAPRSGPR